jgi:hypothetical protein
MEDLTNSYIVHKPTADSLNIEYGLASEKTEQELHQATFPHPMV